MQTIQLIYNIIAINFNTEHPNWYGISKFDAVHALVGEQITQKTDGSFDYHDGQTQPSEEEIQTKLTELRDAEPMRLLRVERNQKLVETDWTQYRDVTLNNDSDWQTYRQSLRDLPQNFSPIIDIITEDGYPIVKEQTDWPEKPS